MGRKRKGSVIGDLGKMWLNTIASPFEALTGQNFVDFKYTSDFGKGASKVVEPLTKGISGAMMAMGTTALNAVAPGAGTALSGMGQGLGQGMKQNSIQQPPMQMSNKTRPTSGINSVPYGVQEGMPKTGYRNGGPMDSKDLNRFIKSSIAANRGKNFVDRIVDPYAPSTNVMGVPATHYMSSAEVDGRNIVYPNVVQRGSGNQLQHLSPEEAIDYALKTGEFMEFGTPEEANNFATNYKQEMTRKFKHGGMLKTYNAPTHENGGQMIDANANPTNNPNKAVGEIEKKETSWNGYVFSDTLGEGKKTFAQMSKEIVNRYKGKRDNLSKKTMEKELSLLVQKNEAARLEKEQMEMQQQQNQFTEEELATLQNPQSPSKEQLDMLFAQQQQQQQGQPSQEQMMQMMQQQQMQQQSQPSEEEMMMMQQMQQQQGAPQDMGQYRWGGNMDVPMYQYQNGGMLEVPEAPLDEYKKGGWIQKVTKSIKKRGTEGVCTGDKFGGPSCPPGSKRYNLAKTFKAMAKKEDGGYIDSFPDLNLANYEDGGMMEEYKDGGMIKRADGSYSQRGLWDNIRDNIGSGKKPTKEMLEQEAKIKAQEYRDGGYVVTRSSDRKGKTHKVTGPDGTVKYFGDPDLKNNPSEKAKDAFYARHKKNLEGNPHFRAYARATWRDGGMIPQYPDGGGLDEIVNAAVPIPQFDTNLNFTPSFVGPRYGYTNKNITAFVNKAKEIKNKYKTLQGDNVAIPYGDQRDNQAFEDFETLKALYAKLPSNAKKEQGNTFSVIEKSLYGDIKDRTAPGYLVQKEISNTGIDRYKPIAPKKPIAQKQNQNSPIEMPPSYPIDRTTAPYTPMAGQSRPRKSLWFKTTPLEDEIAYDAYDDTYVVPQYQPPAIPDFNLKDVASVGNLFNAPTTNAPNYTPLNQQFPVGTPSPNPYAQMLRGAAKVAQQYSESGERPGEPLPQYTPSQWPYGSGNLEMPTLPSQQQQEIQNTPLQDIPGNYVSAERIPTPYEQADAFQQQMIAGPQAAQGNATIQYAPGYTPETPVQEEDPFKLRPLEYATIGLKGAALGKSIYDALQPAEKEQLRLNREAGLVNNMMAGRNVNMAAALNEALYNRNAALASNQARSANVQRALDMQTYSNSERNAIRSKLEEQNMNNQLRMQEAQTRAQLGAAEAAERVRRQNIQSMNEAARRAFGQQAFADLSTIGSELNKEQRYRDAYKNQKDIIERDYNQYMSFINANSDIYKIAPLTFAQWQKGEIPKVYYQPRVQADKKKETPQEEEKQ